MSAIVTLRRAILGSVRAVGGFRLIGNSRWRQRHLLILCYHGVSIDDEHEWDSSLFISQDLLRERFDMLRRAGCNLLPLDEALLRLEQESLPPRSVALTFDDGWRDFPRRALPVLQEFNYPAVVYLSTYYCIHRHPVLNVLLQYLVWKCLREGGRADRVVAEITNTKIRSASRAEITQGLMNWFYQTDPPHEERHEAARALATEAGIDYDCLLASGMMQLMSPDEVRCIVARGIPVELHTHRHRTPLQEEVFKQEIRQNRECIASIAPDQPRPVHFCYPSGVYVPQFYKWLEDEGVRSATTCRSGLAGPATNRLTLPRYVHNCTTSALDFESWLCGASHLLPRRS